MEEVGKWSVWRFPFLFGFSFRLGYLAHAVEELFLRCMISANLSECWDQVFWWPFEWTQKSSFTTMAASCTRRRDLWFWCTWFPERWVPSSWWRSFLYLPSNSLLVFLQDQGKSCNPKPEAQCFLRQFSNNTSGSEIIFVWKLHLKSTEIKPILKKVKQNSKVWSIIYLIDTLPNLGWI